MEKNNMIGRRQFLADMTAAGMGLPFVHLFPLKLMDDKNSINRDICIFSKHLQFLPDYQSMAEVAAEIGFDGVDLTVRPGGHVRPEDVEKDLPLAVESIKSVGLKVPMIVTQLTASDDPYAELIVKSARALNISFYRMGYMRYDDKIGVERSLSQIRSKIVGLIELNKKYKMNAAYQNHAGDRVGGPVWDLWLLMKDFDPQWISCQYDVRHATVEGAYSWPLAMELLFPYIKTTAIKDYYWIKDKNKWKIQNCPLGEGMVDFETYFQHYKRAGITGPVSLHIEYDHYDEADSLEVKRQKTITVMKKDLNTISTMLKKNDL
jgi:sugar phosphate isomerase/epimerase